jgi:hypothetical protein
MHNFRVYWISLYMFRTVFPSIIRSSRLYTQHHVCLIQVSWLLASAHEPASKQSTNLYDIYLMLCVQSWTPDDGRKDRAKHVVWYSINSKIVHLVGFTVETYTVLRKRSKRIWLISGVGHFCFVMHHDLLKLYISVFNHRVRNISF